MNTKCKNCKKEISKNIKFCPYCGNKIKTNYLLIILGILLIIIYPIGGIIFCLTAMGIISILIMIFMFYALIKIPTMID